MASHTELKEMIEEYSTSKYHIECKGFLTNHFSHGIIALYGLGASRQRILNFVRWYVPRLEPTEQEEQSHQQNATPENPLLDEERLKGLLG